MLAQIPGRAGWRARLGSETDLQLPPLSCPTADMAVLCSACGREGLSAQPHRGPPWRAGEKGVGSIWNAPQQSWGRDRSEERGWFMLTLHGKGPPTLGFQSGLQAILCDVDICGGAVPAACADGPEVGNGPAVGNCPVEQRKGGPWQIKRCRGAVPVACTDGPEVGNSLAEQKGVPGRKDCPKRSLRTVRLQVNPASNRPHRRLLPQLSSLQSRPG